LLLSLDLPFLPLPLDDDAEAPPQCALLPLDPISPEYHSTQNDAQITSLPPKSFDISDLTVRGIAFIGPVSVW